MEYPFTIQGRLPGLNEYIAANRSNPYQGAKMKARSEKMVRVAIWEQLKGIQILVPVKLTFCWYEKNRKRDHDNVSSFGRKVIQDALVSTGVLRDDGWEEVVGFSDEFYLDREHPRIEVKIKEVRT